MTVADSTWYELSDHSSEPFDLVRVSIADGTETAKTLGAVLLHGLTDTDHLSDLMARHGFQGVSQYVRERRVPSRLNIRVANFGEIVSGHLLEAEENLHRPIEKLRYTFNHEWSPQLTDIFAVLVENCEITTFAYCEVKSGTTSPDADVGAKGYRDLLKVWRQKTPEILHFTAERLWEAKQYDEYFRLDRAMFSAEPIPELLRLVLVFDELVWSESVLEAVATAIGQDSPPDDSFVCYLVTRPDLRTLVEDSYQKMADLAVGT